MRSKADETFVIVETLICPLQIYAKFARDKLLFRWLGIVVWGQSPAGNRARPRGEMKSRCPGKAMQKMSLYSLE